MNNLKVTFLGTPDFVKPVKEALEKNFTLVEKPEEANILVVAAYGQILPKEILEAPTHGSLNIHPSLLPKYRGPSPLQAAILNGDKETGVTIISMDEKMDHGPIISQKLLEVRDDDTFESLAKRAFEIGAEMIVEVIKSFEIGSVEPKEQDETAVSFTKLITKDDGYFEIQNPPEPEVLQRMIRAYYPWPGVWTIWKGDRQQGTVDRIVKFLPGGLVQMEGKKATDRKSFMNGYPNFPIKHIISD